MSEYMEKHSVSRLIGAPPGYIGFEQGGQLTEAVRRQPWSVILLDEIEKAHPDVFNTLLQLLDDGRLTDSRGKTVDFRNTVVIMTSNIGSNFLLDALSEQEDTDPAAFEEASKKAVSELRTRFRPEFLNRVDEIVTFKPLEKGTLSGIVHLLVKELEERLAEQEIALEVSNEAAELIVKKAYEPAFGARPLRRYIQRSLETQLARAILSSQVGKGQKVRIDTEAGELVFTSDGEAIERPEYQTEVSVDTQPSVVH